MTRRSHVSLSLIFNTPSPYQKLEQKEVPLLSEVAAQLNRIMNLVFTQAKNPESSFRDNKEYNCTDNQVRHVGV